MQQKRIVEKYSDFLKKKIDPEVSKRVLDLNSSKEFKSRGIDIYSTGPEYYKPYSNIKIPKSINDYFKDLGSKRVFCLFGIKYSSITTQRTDMPLFIGVMKDENGYGVRLFTNEWVDFNIGSRKTNSSYRNYEVLKSIDEIVEKFKSIIPLHDEELKRQRLAISNREKEKQERDDRAKKFTSKFTKQFIMDEFSNVFDLCGEYEIDSIRPLDPIYITLWMDKKEYVSSDVKYYTKINQKMVDIMDELISTKERLEEEGLDMEISIGKNIIIKLTEIAPEKTNEGIKDVFKKRPVDPEITKEILDLNNSERFKKNNIKIEKFDLKSNGKFISKYIDHATMNNIISFKAILPEEVPQNSDWDEYKKIKELFIFIRQSKRHPEQNGSKNYNLYITSYAPKEIDWIFEWDSPHESGYLVTKEEINQIISNKICGIYENHLKNESDKRKKDSHQKSFFEKFDEQYIKDIFADVLTLCPGEIKQRKTGEPRASSNQGDLGGFWLLKLPLKTKKDSSAHAMNHVYDDLVSEIFEELSVARDRLRDDNLVMSFNMTGGSLSTNPTLYIVVRDKIKQDEEDYVPEQAPDDWFP